MVTDLGLRFRVHQVCFWRPRLSNLDHEADDDLLPLQRVLFLVGMMTIDYYFCRDLFA